MNENLRTTKQLQSTESARNPFFEESHPKHSYGFKSREREERIVKRKKEHMKKKRIIAILLSMSVLILLGFLYTVFRFRAIVTLDLSTYQKGSDTEYTAYLEPTGTMVPFYLTTETIDINKSLSATGTKQVSQIAEGTVTFYNKLPSNQKFKAKTRLSDDNGNIYLTENKEFVLPAGTDEAPGIKKVNVVSQKPGEEYNKKEGVQLKILGWKGTLKYEKQYAIVNNISGGKIGVIPDIDETELEKEKNNARSNLLTALTERAHANMDDSLMVYPVPESLVVNGLETSVSPTNATEMILKESGSITILKIKKNDLAGHIAAAYGLVLKPNESDIKFIIKNEKEVSLLPITTLPTDLYGMESFTFKVNGDPQISYGFNTTKFIDNIKGKTVNEAEKLIKNIFDFKHYEIKVRPFWMNYLPKKSEYIELIVK